MSRLPKLPACQRHYTFTDRTQATGERLFLQYNIVPEYVAAAEVFSLYVAVLPAGNIAKEPNPWIIALDIGDQATIMIELRQVDSLGNTIVLCSAGPQILTDGSLEGCAKSWAITVQGGSIVADWLERLVMTGSTRYRLVNQLGFLWWFDCILYQLKDFFKKIDEIQDVKLWLRHHWSEKGLPTSDMMPRLEKGLWLPME